MKGISAMDLNQPAALEQLRKKVISQKTVEFPREPVDDEEIDRVRIRLETFDQLVSTMVIQVLQGTPVPMPVDEVDPTLEADLSALQQAKPETYRKLIAKYRQFKERLDAMFDLAIRASAEMRPK
jgi:hypothetical protein